MADQCLICEYASIEEANVGLEVLGTADFTEKEVSLVTRLDEESLERMEQMEHPEPQAKESPPTGKTIGLSTLVGGAIATPLAIGSMIGPLFIAGPLLGMAAGAAVGGLLSGMRRWGLEHDLAVDYEQRVLDGAVLILVCGDDEIRLDDADRLLKTTSFQSIDRFVLSPDEEASESKSASPRSS